ncbi:hypothetical protein CERSUDRAFT_114619 [Gelatoporia subvermispora B]|uniref:Uncharacterized protein n=1 Tax=Ceriporiopsis subvermispora (strain B) TaxID=914234 RepID=M2RDY7_CERS8|nr:hypothetical protein CERSUDRAFT_114619 [Gelatoporia subvermispora B]
MMSTDRRRSRKSSVVATGMPTRLRPNASGASLPSTSIYNVSQHKIWYTCKSSFWYAFPGPRRPWEPSNTSYVRTAKRLSYVNLSTASGRSSSSTNGPAFLHFLNSESMKRRISMSPSLVQCCHGIASTKIMSG